MNVGLKTSMLPAGPAAVAEAARLLAEGGLVAFPTETVYGLGADATNAAAIARLYQAKGRPAFNPLIAHVGDLAAARRIAQFRMGKPEEPVCWQDLPQAPAPGTLLGSLQTLVDGTPALHALETGHGQPFRYLLLRSGPQVLASPSTAAAARRSSTTYRSRPSPISA